MILVFKKFHNSLKGEPIVNNIADVLRCFYTIGLDYLIVGDLILEKNIDYDAIAEFDK